MNEEMSVTTAALALERARSRAFSQPGRVELALEYGVFEALAAVVPEESMRRFLLDEAAQLLSGLAARGYASVSIVEREYPSRLSTVRDAPLLVHYEGTHQVDEQGVAIVGSRKAGTRSLVAAREIAAGAGELGMSVISGLAAGIDAAAHEAALESGLRTVAVMGTELTTTYPSAHRGLRDRIVASGGEIVTQFASGAVKLGPAAFPMRNTTMSGLAMATVIVTAEEKSGTRHQAERAVHHGRPLVLLPHVVDATTWGKRLADLPDVYVPYSVDDVRTVLQLVMEREDVIQSVFA